VFSFEEALDFWGGTAQEALLEDPRADFDFGFVTEVAADGSSLTIDFAEFLTGEEANEAAVAAGDIAPGEFVDNDYYIRNENPMLRTFPVAPDVDLQVIGFFLEGDTGQGLDGIALTRREWAKMFIAAQQCMVDGFPEGCAELGGEGWIWYGGGLLPYWVLVEDGVILAIDEQYLP